MTHSVVNNAGDWPPHPLAVQTYPVAGTDGFGNPVNTGQFQTVGHISIVPELWPNWLRLNYAQAPMWTWPAAPTECGGEVHVFTCEHARCCRCGETRRVGKRKDCQS